jgi:phage shock protein C
MPEARRPGIGQADGMTTTPVPDHSSEQQHTPPTAAAPTIGAAFADPPPPPSSAVPPYRVAPQPQATFRLLRRSRNGRLLGGVCRGFADYAGFDPVLVRLVLVLAVLLGFGSGLLLYIAGWLLIPEDGTPNAWLDRYISQPTTR